MKNKKELSGGSVKKTKPNKKITKKQWISLAIALVANVIFFCTIWFLERYDHVDLEQILFHLKAPKEGASQSFVFVSILTIGGYSILSTAVQVLCYLFFGGYFSRLKAKSRGYAKFCKTEFSVIVGKKELTAALCLLIVSLTVLVTQLGIISYISLSSEESDFIKVNYTDPKTVELKFPEKKRNLIYIFLESMETTYADPSAGGAIEADYIPELSALARENVNFSHNEGIGGAMSFAGTNWTAAALVAQTSGITTKVSLASPNYGSENHFLPGAYTIGEVLESQGYNQTLLVGSNAVFGGRKAYFEEHGNYKIVDTESLKESGRLAKDYNVFWGIEDEKLIKYAKEEITSLYESGQPFNFTMLTADTHFPEGWYCKDCENKWKYQYANVLSCSSKRIYNFVEWIKQQPFYEDTLVVISGDHLTMDPEFLEYIEPRYVRTVYNCFINSAVAPKKSKNRIFGTMDFYPTTLAGMGVTIEGDRLGLGTNLFSDKETLSEKYGYLELDTELQKKSTFYNKKILQMDASDSAS